MQVALYGLMLEARYGTVPLDGLLWYSSSDDLERTSLSAQDVAGTLFVALHCEMTSSLVALRARLCLFCVILFVHTGAATCPVVTLCQSGVRLSKLMSMCFSSAALCVVIKKVMGMQG
jgi:hypothetical protein